MNFNKQLWYWIRNSTYTRFNLPIDSDIYSSCESDVWIYAKEFIGIPIENLFVHINFDIDSELYDYEFKR